MRELFIYYRVAAADLDAALSGALALQARLRESVAQLDARLLRRSAASGEFETWMETYALRSQALGESGIDAALEARIAADAEVLRPWIDGERHVEAFVGVAPLP